MAESLHSLGPTFALPPIQLKRKRWIVAWILLVLLSHGLPHGVQNRRGSDNGNGWTTSLQFAQRIACGPLSPQLVRGEALEFPAPDPRLPIEVTGSVGSRWTEGSYEVWHLTGGVQIRQGPQVAQSQEAAIWIDRRPLETPGQFKLIAYLEKEARVDYAAQGQVNPQAQVTDDKWLGRFYSVSEPVVRVGIVQPPPGVRPAITMQTAGLQSDAFAANSFGESQSFRPQPASNEVQPEVAFQPALGPGPQPNLMGTPVVSGPPVDPLQQYLDDPFPRNDAPVSGRRIRFAPRSGVAPRIQVKPDPARNETMVYVDNGLRVLIDGQVQAGNEAVSLLDLAADRVVIWYGSSTLPNLTGDNLDDGTRPLEVYLEGNIVFRQGQRTIFAERMYYDVTQKRGVVLNVELLTPAQAFAGNVRLRADVLEQLNENRFIARNAMLTTSRLGVPSYWFQAGSIDFLDEQLPVVNRATGMPVVDSVTGTAQIEHRQSVSSSNNLLYVNQVPLFYWPFFATDLRRPAFYLRSIKARQDRVFGTQVMADWDMYQLLGIRAPLEGTDWDLSTDYLSDRGFGLGTSFQYQRENFFGFDSPHAGFIDAWGIRDSGQDNLGLGRRVLEPEQDFRGRVLARHRQQLPYDLQLTGELGYLSDRNFLEQYFENEWDNFKDQSTGLELKQYRNNSSWSVTADGRINDFLSQTEWLPRGDHFLIGQSLLGDSVLWHAHTHVGYANTNLANAPKSAAELPFFSTLPGEANASGEVLATRHELEAPFELGPVRFSPFVLGEAARWGEALSGDPLDRLYGRAGVRATLPMHAIFPNVEDPLFNVHGLAHKLNWYTEFAYSQTTDRLSDLAIYEQLDDDAQEQFRRRFTVLEYGGALPAQFDPRFYALRSGLGGNVTSPSAEIADNQMLLKFGLRQRLQTKRGNPEAPRIIDWMVLDTRAIFFPDATRDNFGQSIGLAQYNYRWYLGDRLTFLSDGTADFFDRGQRIFSAGGLLNRPRLGSLYLGFNWIDGPVQSRVINAAYSYRLSPKWLSTFNTSYDFSKAGNIGQRFSLTRVGESFLLSLGVNVDASRNNYGFQFSLEPRLFPSTLANRLGASVPGIGEYGFE